MRRPRAGDATTSTAAARRPTLLLALLGLAAFLAIFDQVITVSSIPLLRNPAAIATALALGLYVWYRREGLPMIPGAQGWIVMFLLYTALLELLRSIWTGDSEWLRYLQWAQVLVLALVTIDIARDRRAAAFIWGGVMAAVTFMAAATVVALPGFTSVLEGRVGFAGVNLNAQGYWYAMGATTAAWWLLRRWPRFGWPGALAFAALGALSLALLETASRSALLGLVMGLATVLTLSLRARNLSAYATVVPAALLVLAFFVADATVLQERFLDAVTEGDLGARDSIAAHAIELLADRPWFGYGPSFLFVLGEARGMTRPISSHNSFLQVALTFGLPALLLWAGIIASAAWRAWQSYARDRSGIGALMVSLIALSMVFALVGDLGFNKYFWTMIALAAQSPLTYPAPTVAAASPQATLHAASFRPATSPGSLPHASRTPIGRLAYGDTDHQT